MTVRARAKQRLLWYANIANWIQYNVFVITTFYLLIKEKLLKHCNNNIKVTNFGFLWIIWMIFMIKFDYFLIWRPIFDKNRPSKEWEHKIFKKIGFSDVSLTCFRPSQKLPNSQRLLIFHFFIYFFAASCSNHFFLMMFLCFKEENIYFCFALKNVVMGWMIFFLVFQLFKRKILLF